MGSHSSSPPSLVEEEEEVATLRCNSAQEALRLRRRLSLFRYPARFAAISMFQCSTAFLRSSVPSVPLPTIYLESIRFPQT